MGEEAWQMLGGESGNVLAVRPLREGTMTEFDVTQRMLAVVLRRVGVTRFPRPRVLVCVPPSSSPVERRAIERAIRYAGGRQVVPVEEPLAAAVGANLPVHEPLGNLIVDIGGGRSEMAVVSMGGVVSGRSASVGGFDLDAAVQEHIRADIRGVDRGEVGRGAEDRDRVRVPVADRPGGQGDRPRARDREHGRGQGGRGRDQAGDGSDRQEDRRTRRG